jgi:hypothetical protein
METNSSETFLHHWWRLKWKVLGKYSFSLVSYLGRVHDLANSRTLLVHGFDNTKCNYLSHIKNSKMMQRKIGKLSKHMDSSGTIVTWLHFRNLRTASSFLLEQWSIFSLSSANLQAMWACDDSVLGHSQHWFGLNGWGLSSEQQAIFIGGLFL